MGAYSDGKNPALIGALSVKNLIEWLTDAVQKKVLHEEDFVVMTSLGDDEKQQTSVLQGLAYPPVILGEDYELKRAMLMFISNGE